jgi:hypothetical protein
MEFFPGFAITSRRYMNISELKGAVKVGFEVIEWMKLDSISMKSKTNENQRTYELALQTMKFIGLAHAKYVQLLDYLIDEEQQYITQSQFITYPMNLTLEICENILNIAKLNFLVLSNADVLETLKEKGLPQDNYHLFAIVHLNNFSLEDIGKLKQMKKFRLIARQERDVGCITELGLSSLEKFIEAWRLKELRSKNKNSIGQNEQEALLPTTKTKCCDCQLL